MKRIPITNQFMFRRVMQDEDICKEFIYSVLGIKVDAIEYQNFEQILEPTVNLKSVRLDLLVRSDDKIYNIELQCQNDNAFLRRLRYYQAAIDTTLLERGDRYKKMNESYIIYLCTFDPLGKGLSKYTIERKCLEDNEVEVDDGSHWIVLNSSAFECEPRKELRELLQYITTGKQACKGSFINKLDIAVTQANEDREWVRNMESVMNAYDDAIWHGYSKGEEAGLAKGLEQGLEQGQQLGLEQFSKLTGILLNLNRIDDLKRASEDEAYRNSLIEEFAV